LVGEGESMRKVLALVALFALAVAFATPLNPPPAQPPYGEMTNDVKVTGSYTLTQNVVYDYLTCYKGPCPIGAIGEWCKVFLKNGYVIGYGFPDEEAC